MEVSRQRRKAAWARLSAEERAARLAPMHSVAPYERTEAMIRRNSAILRNRWAQGEVVIAGERQCIYCDSTFKPNSGRQLFCNRQCKIDHNAATLYKVPISELRRMRSEQDNACAICRRVTKLNVDHDHATGAIRGLLCVTCNTGLGKLGDDVENLRRALAYLGG